MRIEKGERKEKEKRKERRRETEEKEEERGRKEKEKVPSVLTVRELKLVQATRVTRGYQNQGVSSNSKR